MAKSSENRRDFYVYQHRRATDGAVFYIGKGTGARMRNRSGRNKHWHNIVAKHGFNWEVVLDCLSHDEAIAEEIALIAKVGRNGLCNLTDGGEGTRGFVLPPETLAAAALKRVGQKRTAETRARMSIARMGKPMPADVREKLSTSLKGVRPSSKAYEGCQNYWTPERRYDRGLRLAEIRSQKVECVETDQVFETLKAAVDWLRIERPKASHCNISACCAGRKRTAYGYHWRYAE